MKKFNYINLFNDLLLASALLISLPSFSQMSGTYTINAGAAASSTNFVSFSTAATSLKQNGVNGTVTINVVSNSGPYFEQVRFDTIPGVSVSKSITINGNGNKIISLPTSTNLHMLRLNGVRNMTINNLVLYDSSDLYGWGIHFMNGADSNTINGCTIDLTKHNTTSSTTSNGIVMSNSTTTPAGAGTTGSYNIIKNNIIKGGVNAGLYYGIRLNGNTATSTGCDGNQILDNTILDSYIYNILLQYTSGTIIKGNFISRPNKITVSSFYGIYLSTGALGTTVSNNRITNTHGAASSLTGLVGALYVSTADGTASNPNVFYNNLVYNINNTGTIYGIYNSGGDYMRCYFNTISLDNSSLSATGVTYGYYQTTTASGLEFLNNIISISRGGSASKYILYWSTNTSSFLSEKNDLYMNASAGSNYTGYWNATTYSTLTDWKTANSNAFDQNSQAADPQYAAPASGDFKPAAAQINNMAAVITGITTDILGVTRNALTPDPGAYEFTPAADDAGLTAFVSPVAPCPGSVSVTVALKNFGSVSMDSVRINWRVNGVLQTMYKHTSSLASSASANVTIGSFTVIAGNTYSIKAWTSKPNGNNDGNAGNDTILLSGLQSAMSGTYTIGTSGDYPTIVAAVAALNSRDVCGNVIFNINPSSGPYRGKLNIGPLDGTSATKTVKFLGHGATMFDTTDVGSYYLVMLNGASYVTIDSLTIQNIGITYGYGVLLTNNSNWNTISNCYINMASCTSTTSTYSAGIALSSSTTSPTTAGNNGNYNTFYNNIIDGGAANPGVYYAVSLVGNSGGGNGNRGNKLLNNSIRNAYVYNIYSAYGDSLIIENNDISRQNKITVSTFYGIYLSTGNFRTMIRNNRIHNTHDNASTTSGSIYGIYSSSDPTSSATANIIYNNLLYDFNGATSTIYALYNSGADYTEYYYNTLSLDHTAATGGSVYTFYQPSAATNVILKNNMFSVTKGGSGTKYGFYFNSGSTNQVSNNNVLYMGSQGSGTQYAGYWGSAVNSFLAWKAVNGGAFDQSSDSASPEFVSIAADNFVPNSITANNIGAAISGITTDFNAVTRNATTPDPGAFEFTPIPSNDSCSKAITVGVGSVNGTTLGASADFAPTCVVADAPSGGVWYKYNSPGHFVIASLCGSSFDTRMRVFTGSCASLTCVTGNENFCGTQSQISGCADSNVTYYMLVYGNGSAAGNFTLNVSEIPVQQATVTASGSTSFCPGDSVVLNAGTNASYEWNDSLLSTSQSITVFGSGNFQVVTTDTNGCVDSSSIVTTTLYSVTQAQITAGGSTDLCEGDSVILEANASASYLWSDSSNGQTLAVTTAGTYTVTTTDSNGCESTSGPVSVVVNALPSVSLGSDTTICDNVSITLDAGSGFSHYNWSTGDTTQTISFSESTAGNYPVSVIISDSNNCENNDELVVTVEICGGIEESGDKAFISVYPNPVNDLVNLVFTGFSQPYAELSISDSRGSLVYNNTLSTSENQVVDLGNLSPGLYILKVSGGDQVQNIRLMVE